MIRLNHKSFKREMVQRQWTQMEMAEKLDISDRYVRKLCGKDTDVKASLLYKISVILQSPMENCLIITDEEDEPF